MKLSAALAGFVAFVVLATANGAGYRYGVSDGAAYVPAVMLAENPAAFPRDAPLIQTQGRFFVIDDILASLGRVTGIAIETRFFGAYLLAMAVVWIGVILIGISLDRGAGRSAAQTTTSALWLTIAFAAIVTLRHHIPRTSANSLEPYFHPRLLAFGIGIIAVAAFLRHRSAIAVALIALAAVCHITTALWFAILVGTALMVVDKRWRVPGGLAVISIVGLIVWAAAAGPLRASASRMDPIWIEALDGRDFIFANEWPVWVWILNVGLLAALWFTHRLRSRFGTATPADSGIVWGATALVALFLATLPLVAAHIALAVQFQFSRVFWIEDFLVAVYVIAVAGETLRREHMSMLALVLLAVSAARGVYIMETEHAERRLFQVSLVSSPWTDAMQWIGRQPLTVHVLAAPDHAFKYGTSVRVAASRDVLLENDKDSAIAMYSRAIAGRIVERRHALAGFAGLDAPAARVLAARYGLDYLVTEATLPLPQVYRNSQFRIYALKPFGPAS